MSKNFRELLVAKGLLGGKNGRKVAEERRRKDSKESIYYVMPRGVRVTKSTKMRY